MNSSIASILSSFPRGRRLGRGVAHRWPALLAAAVAVAVPATVALGAEEFSTAKFLAGAQGTAYETAVIASGFYGAGVETTSYGNTALKAVSGQMSQLAIFAKGGGTGIEAEGAGYGLKARALTTTGTGVGVQAQGNTIGVDASSDNGLAIEASGKTGGVIARSTEGTGLRATGKVQAIQAYADAPGSWGVNAFGADMGVYAEGGTGVRAKGSGLGGEFTGAQAPIRLVPATSTGAPTTGTHKRGELYVDSQGSLFLCIADSSTSTMAGTWKKVVLQ